MQHPQTTPNNLSTNSHTTIPTGPTPITGKFKDGTPIPRHLYPMQESGTTSHYITDQGLLDQFLSVNTPTTL